MRPVCPKHNLDTSAEGPSPPVYITFQYYSAMPISLFTFEVFFLS